MAGYGEVADASEPPGHEDLIDADLADQPHGPAGVRGAGWHREGGHGSSPQEKAGEAQASNKTRPRRRPHGVD